MKKIIVCLALPTAVLLVALLILIVQWFCFKQQGIVPKKGLHFTLKSGTSADNLIAFLKEKGELDNPLFFKLLLYFNKAGDRLQAGEYFFPAGSTPTEIMSQVTSGQVVQHRFTLVNGWNIYQTIRAINHNPYIHHTLNDKTPQQIAKVLKIKHKTPEGLLYPDTYYFTRGTSDRVILLRAHRHMQNYLKKAWNKRAQGLPYKNAYQALIVASMVEKETNLKQEMPVIADVILKRLKKWMHLQIDSTVIYGLEPGFSEKLTVNDLRQKTPYNTYTHYGLPPTPIAMPGASAIQAALHPEKTAYWYFVAKGDGSHEFSSNLKEQNKAVKKYQIDSQNKQEGLKK